MQDKILQRALGLSKKDTNKETKQKSGGIEKDTENGRKKAVIVDADMRVPKGYMISCQVKKGICTVKQPFLKS